VQDVDVADSEMGFPAIMMGTLKKYLKWQSRKDAADDVTQGKLSNLDKHHCT
jgi:hypothetical protein